MAETTTQQTTPEGQQSQTAQQTGTQQSNTQQAGPAFDYDKLASIIAGKQSVAEDTTLKGYFKQQGLSKEEADQAISAFKQQKEANTPDVAALQTQAAQAQQIARQEQMKTAATLAAVAMGIDAKNIPYVLKMADLSQVQGEDGKINDETLKAALEKVLEDVPALKTKVAEAKGFIQVGAPNGTGVAQQTTSTAQVPTKKWNRFN